MVPVFIYWGSMLVLAAWFIWNIVFSTIYLGNKENGNLQFFAMINAIALIFGVIVELVFNNWKFGVTLSSWFTVINIAYVVLIVLQVIFGRESKPKVASSH